MSSLNKVMIIGNLGQTPEVKFLPSGQAVCELSVAVNEKWKDKDDKLQERVEWVRCVVWGKMGENCGKYLEKGRQVFVEGRMQTRSWDDKESGEKRYRTEVVATSVQFLGGGGGGKRDGAPDRDEADAPKNRKSGGGGGGDDFGPPPGDDDIPFLTSRMSLLRP
jgi:single-strand DNA-binding protein